MCAAFTASEEERLLHLLKHSGGPDDIVGGPKGSRLRSRAVLKEIRLLDAIEAQGASLTQRQTMWRDRLRQRNEQLKRRKSIDDLVIGEQQQAIAWTILTNSRCTDVVHTRACQMISPRHTCAARALAEMHCGM